MGILRELLVWTNKQLFKRKIVLYCISNVTQIQEQEKSLMHIPCPVDTSALHTQS